MQAHHSLRWTLRSCKHVHSLTAQREKLNFQVGIESRESCFCVRPHLALGQSADSFQLVKHSSGLNETWWVLSYFFRDVELGDCLFQSLLPCSVHPRHLQAR